MGSMFGLLILHHPETARPFFGSGKEKGYNYIIYVGMCVFLYVCLCIMCIIFLCVYACAA